MQRYATGLATAANNAIAEKWGESTRTRPLFWHTAEQQAFEYIQLGIPLELARQAIADSMRRSRKPEPPSSINYFDAVITDAFKASQQRALDAQHPAPAKRGGPATRIGIAVAERGGINLSETRDAREREQALQVAYDEERARAGVEWGKDPANAALYQTILDAATEAYALTIKTSWGQNARNTTVINECAKAAGFPSFSDWKWQRAFGSPPQPGLQSA